MRKYRILYEDKDLFVIDKPPGLAVQSARPDEPDLMSLLRNELLERGVRDPYLGLVNRLDQPVEGILLIAANGRAAANLSRQIQDHVHTEKWYQALVHGRPEQTEGTLVDYLAKDEGTNRSRVVAGEQEGGKRCVLDYQILELWEDKSLLKIRLMTGRKHQIRVQLAHAGCPIVGDHKYGDASDEGRLCLCSCQMIFLHPRTGRPMSFRVEPTFPVPPTAPVPEEPQRDR